MGRNVKASSKTTTHIFDFGFLHEARNQQARKYKITKLTSRKQYAHTHSERWCRANDVMTDIAICVRVGG